MTCTDTEAERRPHTGSYGRPGPLRLAALALCLALLASPVAAALRPASSGWLSSSKLSLHLINQYTAGAARVIAAHPRVLKILDTHEPMLRAARDYKRITPQGKVVLRIYTSVRYAVQDDPAASARDFWTKVLEPPLRKLSASDRALIDYLEGPNEGDSTPTWGSLQDAEWLSRFWVELAERIHQGGFRPCIGSIAVGNPGGDAEQRRGLLAAFVPALRKARSLGGAWSYHAYTLQYTTDPSRETWYSLRYRQLHDDLVREAPDLAGMPLILTEGGVDESGNPAESGWRARGTAERYQQWLAWFDRELRRDRYVVGCTLFQIGDPEGWSSFDLEPMAGWLANHLRSGRPLVRAGSGASAGPSFVRAASFGPPISKGGSAWLR